MFDSQTIFICKGSIEALVSTQSTVNTTRTPFYYQEQAAMQKHAVMPKKISHTNTHTPTHIQQNAIQKFEATRPVKVRNAMKFLSKRKKKSG